MPHIHIHTPVVTGWLVLLCFFEAGLHAPPLDRPHSQGEHEKAATLYMKGGKLSKAVEMCFQAQLFDVLQHIADDMTPEKSDPGLYNR